MSMKNQKKQNNLTIEQVRERIDEYKGTIHALQAFISLTTWDPGSRQQGPGSIYSFGRRMTTSANNQIAPNIEVTPDAVIQASQQTGYTVEAKYSLPKDTRHWEDDASQLLKYDDDLTGWWTRDERISTCTNVMLIHWSRSVQFVEFLESWITQNQVTLSPSTAIVEFTKADNAKEFYNLRLLWGQVADATLTQTLKYGKMVPIEKVVGTYGSKKFYDTEPIVVEFTMAIIWQDYLNERADRSLHDKKLGGIPIYINLDELTIELQKLFGQPSNSNRDVEFPHKSWIQTAMDEFVNIKLARPLENDPNGYDYLVIFRRINKELLEYFVESRKKARKNPTAKQLGLFEPK